MPEESKKKRPYRRKKTAVAEVAPAKDEFLPEAEEAQSIASSAPPQPTRVSLTDMWAMRLAQQERRTAEVESKLAEAEAETARMTRLYALAKLDPKGIVSGIEKKQQEALDRAAQAAKRAEQAENRALLVRKKMEQQIGRPMTNLAIDPDTGEVIHYP